MWLQYALDKDNNLVSIDEVKRGRSNVRCPYCQGELIAKKGKIKAHHFAHTEETCNWAVTNRNINLPLFWGFNLVLSRSYLNSLIELEQRNFQLKYYSLKSLQRDENRIFGHLKRKKVISKNVYYQVELTALGKVILKKPSLLEFCEIQEQLSQEKFIELRKRVLSSEDFYKRVVEHKKTHYEKYSAKKKKTIDYNLEFGEQELKQAQADFIIYHAQYQRVLQNNLYFLEINAPDKTFYKIGVTSRGIEERIKEIKLDLSKLFNSFSISLLGVWSHRGNIEHYFKYRYEDYHFPLVRLTEYFQFEKIEPILAELNTLGDKQLNQLEQDILNSSAEKLVFSDKVRRGMERAKFFGVHTGRPSSSSESTKKFLAKPKNKAIATVLKKGLSLRQTAKETGASVNTVKKVKAALEDSQS